MRYWKCLLTCVFSFGIGVQCWAQGYGSFVDPKPVRLDSISARNKRPMVGQLLPKARSTQVIPDDFPATFSDLHEGLSAVSAERIMPDSTLGSLVKQLNALGIPTVLDRNSLADASVSSEDRVQIPLAAIGFDQALTVALDELDIGWTMLENGTAILLASQEEIEERLITVTYDVSRICQGDFDTLVEVIRSTVDPDSWDDVGGPGTAQPMPIGSRDLLVVSNSFPTQLATRRLLNSLGRMGGSALRVSTRNGLMLPGRSMAGYRHTLPGSSVIAMPNKPKKRGIALPNRTGDGSPSGFGGGMGGMAGGMF